MVKMKTATIRYGSGLTLNMGNYESARFDLSIELSCDDNPKEIEETYKRAVQFVSKRLDEQEKRVKL